MKDDFDLRILEVSSGKTQIKRVFCFPEHCDSSKKRIVLYLNNFLRGNAT